MSAELARLLGSFHVSQAIHAAAELGVADLLADGNRTADDLAEACGADPATLYRLLRALGSLGVLEEADGRRFSLAPLGEGLRTDVDGSLHGWAILIGRDHVWRSWGNLTDAVRTGENSFRLLHGTSEHARHGRRPRTLGGVRRAVRASGPPPLADDACRERPRDLRVRARLVTCAVIDGGPLGLA